MSKELSTLNNLKLQIFGKETGKVFTELLPKDFDVRQFKTSLFLEIQNTYNLEKCANVIDLARDCANFGLLPNGLAGQCYFIPFYNKKKNAYEAKLIIGYKGYITKLEEAGYTIETELVTKEEIKQGKFEETRGSEVKITHTPIRAGIRTRDDIALAYAIVRKEGLTPIISVLSKEEIEEMANAGKALQNTWLSKDRKTDYGQMCLKTVIRNVCKKVKLKIANEMSAYEGKRDQQIMKDVTPSGDNFYENQKKEIEEAEKKKQEGEKKEKEQVQPEQTQPEKSEPAPKAPLSDEEKKQIIEEDENGGN